MTLDACTETGRFGLGAEEPYTQALTTGTGTLHLEVEEGSVTGKGCPGTVHYDVRDWFRGAGQGEYALLRDLGGPVLDLGCGPGRMMEAADRLGLSSLGVDSHPLAVELARQRGCEALAGSIFDDLPQTGQWMSVLLLDGNIGIGGDPARLLARTAQLLHPEGVVVVETDPCPELDVRYSALMRDGDGRTSSAFPWSRVSVLSLPSYARSASLMQHGTVVTQGRVFSLLRRSTT